MASAKTKQTGQALPLALMALGTGALIIGPLLGVVSTGVTALRRGGAAQSQYYSADSGVEHAIWRLRYEPGFAASIESGGPVNYSITVNGMLVEVAVSAKPLDTEGEAQTGWIRVAKTVDPTTAPLGPETLFTYTIQVENYGLLPVYIQEIGDRMPAGFIYQPGSSGGLTTNDPLVQGTELVWTFPWPWPLINPTEVKIQTFQARATIGEGIYYNEAWVDPWLVSPTSTGPTAPIVPDGNYYDIEAQAGTVVVRSSVRINAGTVDVLSWDIQ